MPDEPEELAQYMELPVIVHLSTGEKVFATLKDYQDDYTLTVEGDGPPENPTLGEVSAENVFPDGKTTIVGDHVVRIEDWDAE